MFEAVDLKRSISGLRGMMHTGDAEAEPAAEPAA